MEVALLPVLHPGEITYFAPQPALAEWPTSFPSPFATEPPLPLVRRAADELQARLRSGALDLRSLDAPGGGKMFGVLLVADAEGRIGYLCAFSGMLAGRWRVDGFAPPLFDEAARAAFWPAGEAELAALDEAHQELLDGVAARACRAAVAETSARHTTELAALRSAHVARKQARRLARVGLEGDTVALHALDQASRADAAERRRCDLAHAGEREAVSAPLRALESQRLAIAAQRAARSRELWQQILDGYVLVSQRGERRTLSALFAPETPPGGAGDCAAPKLLARARALGLRPLGLAELWWGAAPDAGGRRAGVYYPACRGKCGPILPHLLDGLPVDAAPRFGGDAIAADEPRLVFEDPWLIVVDKPCGLLSVPGRHHALRDSVLVRLRTRYPDATGPLLVHRLDLDTSGLLLAAKDADTHAALQRAFARREIDKRYLAWLDGEVTGEHGVIDLALRVDLDDRPRQLHDPVHGKRALTEWRVLARADGRTRVALYPRTGRTHQLRVHAAHPRGLGAAIVGDRLYGRASAGERMMLHAEALELTHPRTGERLTLTRPAPF